MEEMLTVLNDPDSDERRMLAQKIIDYILVALNESDFLQKWSKFSECAFPISRLKPIRRRD